MSTPTAGSSGWGRLFAAALEQITITIYVWQSPYSWDCTSSRGMSGWSLQARNNSGTLQMICELQIGTNSEQIGYICACALRQRWARLPVCQELFHRCSYQVSWHRPKQPSRLMEQKREETGKVQAFHKICINLYYTRYQGVARWPNFQSSCKPRHIGRKNVAPSWMLLLGKLLIGVVVLM